VKTKTTLIIGGAVAAALFVSVNVAHAALRAETYPGYWRDRMREPIPAHAIRLVALGDSTVEAIGAGRPLDGYVGRIAGYLTARTGRPVHIVNVSTGGATRDIIRNQLPRVDLRTADIVIVADDNDLQQRAPLAQYRAELTTLMAALPPDRTVYSDLPLEPGRGPYQAVLHQVADAHGIMRADFAGVFSHDGRRLDIFSWLPPHLNSRGYGYWFEAFRPKVDVIIGRLDSTDNRAHRAAARHLPHHQ